jgi:hypothetical protein
MLEQPEDSFLIFNVLNSFWVVTTELSNTLQGPQFSNVIGKLLCAVLIGHLFFHYYQVDWTVLALSQVHLRVIINYFLGLLNVCGRTGLARQLRFTHI